MKRIVIRPRIQTPLLVLLFAVFVLLGVTFFTGNDNVIAKRDWFGLVLGVMSIAAGVLGIWRALRMGVVIDTDGIRVRGFDSRDRVTQWGDVLGIEVLEVDSRAGRPVYAPVIELADDNALPIKPLGSYSREDAERKAELLWSLGTRG